MPYSKDRAMSELVEALERAINAEPDVYWAMERGQRIPNAALERILSVIESRVRAEERERAASIAEKWRDENKTAAAKARKRTRALAGTPFEDSDMADMLDGAAIECNAIAAAIRSGDAG